MRTTTTLALALGLALLPARACAEEGVKLPLRKAGQWELRTIMDEGAGPRPEHALQLCIDAKMEESTAAASDVEHRTNCKSYTIKTEGSMTVMEADCDFGRQLVQSRTEMSGDFQKEFQIKISSTTTRGGGDNKAVPINRTITQVGRYISEKCQDGLAPGEAIAADGTKMMVQ
jgi:hypothetical protein